jgi:septal ring factor EnvC (AmiA/AmiB activator)
MESAAAVTLTLISLAGAFLAQVQVDWYRTESQRLAVVSRQIKEDLEEERARVGRRDAELEDLEELLDVREEEIKQLEQRLAATERTAKETDESYNALLGCGILSALGAVLGLMIWAFYIGNSPLLAKCSPPRYPLL